LQLDTKCILLSDEGALWERQYISHRLIVKTGARLKTENKFQIDGKHQGKKKNM